MALARATSYIKTATLGEPLGRRGQPGIDVRRSEGGDAVGAGSLRAFTALAKGGVHQGPIARGGIEQGDHCRAGKLLR